MVKKYSLFKFPLIINNINNINNSGGAKNTKSRLTENTIDTLNKTINKQQFLSELEFHCKHYPYTPAILSSVPRIIVMGDIHGDYKLAIHMFKLANLIKINKDGTIKWIGRNTVVVQVGDQIDRCRPVGAMTCENPNTTYNDEASDIKILKLFTDLDIQSRLEGGKVISLFGNHELMNSMGQLSYVSYEGIQEFNKYKDKKNPNKTFQSPLEARKYAFSPGNEIGKFLGCTRLPAVIIGNNLFVHAGMINSIIKYLNINEKSDLETINMAVKKWLLGLLNETSVDKIIESSKNSMFWTRVLGSLPPNINMNDTVCSSYINNVLTIFKIDNIIIGHTPQSFLYSDGINSTCSNKIWRVDNGSSSAFNNFDQQLLNNGHTSHSRRPQVLEILNDTEFKVLG